ncbi:MAG: TorF family putative porin [Desulfobia sp.]
MVWQRLCFDVFILQPGRFANKKDIAMVYVAKNLVNAAGAALEITIFRGFQLLPETVTNLNKKGNKMKKIIGSSTLILLLVFSSINVMAEKKNRPTASADTGVYSKYVWRGYELSNDSAVIQPSITFSYMDVSLNLWGNLDTRVDDSSHSNQFNETDMTLSYHRDLGHFSLGLGYIYYGLDGADDAEELYLSAGLDTILSPTLTVYRDIAHMPSWYMSFTLSHSFELPKDITLDLAGSAGYYHSCDQDDIPEYNGRLAATNEKYRGFHNGLVSIGLTVPVGEYATVCPVIAYSFPLTEEANDHIAGTNTYSNDSDYVYGGANLSVCF